MIIKCLDVKSHYHSIISDSVEFAEKSFPLRVCFGGIVQSIGYNLGNASSDIDVILFYISESDIDIAARQILNNTVHFRGPVDLIMIDMALLNYVDLPTNQIERSIFPNHIKEHFNFDYGILPGNTNCKLRSVITETLYCRKVWDDRRYLSANAFYINKFLTVYDYIKWLFVYGQGRLEKYLIGDRVRLRSYLYTARDVLIIEHILAKGEFPEIDFMRLLDNCDNISAKEMLQGMYEKNSGAVIHKSELTIEPIEMLNQYFADKLSELKPQVEKFFCSRRNDLFDIGIEY